ncbi:MAG: zinc-dependent metalloprotease [Planctomycetes bacterium]|nr:zinc-dependent metalloprotease [Planctomycetota bacterium]
MQRTRRISSFARGLLLAAAVIVAGTFTASAQMPDEKKPSPPKPDYPPLAEVTEGFEKVVSTVDDKPSLYTLWVRKKDGQMLAELPRNFANEKHFFAMTVASGETYAGLQAGDMYVYWRQYDKRLALIEPNIEYKAPGDAHSKASVERLFTDRVLLDVPILAMGSNGGPVIDLDALLIGEAGTFFGRGTRVTNAALLTIKKAKAFPENIEVAFEVPTADFTGNGRLKTLHYSISTIKPNPQFKPRVADERVGYFITAYSDLGKYKDEETRVRYITRWHMEKKDEGRSISLPKNPITFYVEHTTPPRYRYWVSEGIKYWNEAFAKIGLREAIRVEYQDAETGLHMEKDPEDVRYNFVRWLNNDIGTAIGPSRINPETGEILDADIILTDGWIRHFEKQFNEIFPQVAMEGMHPETLAWLAKHPNWDPRVRLAPPSQREHIRARLTQQSFEPYAGTLPTSAGNRLMGDHEHDGLIGRTSQLNGLCLAADGKAFDVSMMRMHLAILEALKEEEGKDEKGEKKDDDKDGKKKDDLLDGMPEDFIGPLLAELVAHEVGHTLGLRHNFKSSSIHPLADINSPKVKGVKPLAGSVMDYLPVNMKLETGKLQGDYSMIGIGPYDMWAIEYGYTFENDLKPILNRVAEPELAYATDEDTYGPDPLARRYDFGKDPLEYAKEQYRLAKWHRGRIVEKFVKDGQSWSHARRGYEMSLYMQMRAVSMMSNWVGGAFVHRDKKGDKDARPPVEVVPADKQREALQFVLEHSFRDEAYGLDSELLKHMTVDKWLDGDNYYAAFVEEPTWPVHDRIMGLQASVLTQLMSPTTLRRVYDNEFRVPADEETLTLPEMLDAVTTTIWAELEGKMDRQCTARQPLISSLRRNLQREHVERLIDLCFPGAGDGAAYKPISNLAMMGLRSIKSKIDAKLKEGEGKIDPYSVAHLTQIADDVDRALKAEYLYNANELKMNLRLPTIFLQDRDGQSPLGAK